MADHPRRLVMRADEGSIPFALLAIVMLTAIMGVLTATAIRSGNAARFDQEYTEVVQAADAAAQQGESRLLRVYDSSTLESVSVPAGCSSSAWTSCTAHESGNVTVDGITASWETRKVSPLRWQSRGTATGPNGVQRIVVVEVVDEPMFNLAAFSDRGFQMRGGNGADSYGAAAWYTGNGIVASNESITLNGASTDVDGVHLYNWDNNPDFGRCTHSGGNGCVDVLTTPEANTPSARIGPKLEVGEDLETSFIDDQLASCPSPLPDYTATTYDGGTGVLGTAGTTTVLCFQSATFNRDVTVQGTVEIYVYGDLALTNGVSVNCGGGCTAGTSTPDARSLTFFVDGADDPDVDPPSKVLIGNHTKIVAGIYAPESECEGNPSNAQAAVFGSLICDTIANQGGWAFHYDDRLGSRGSGIYGRAVWREERP